MLFRYRRHRFTAHEGTLVTLGWLHWRSVLAWIVQCSGLSFR